MQDPSRTKSTQIASRSFDLAGRLDRLPVRGEADLDGV